MKRPGIGRTCATAAVRAVANRTRLRMVAPARCGGANRPACVQGRLGSQGLKVLSQWLCRVFGHRRDAKRAWHDLVDYRSRCKRCGVEMLRDRHGWRTFDPEADADPRRNAKKETGAG